MVNEQRHEYEGKNQGANTDKLLSGARRIEVQISSRPDQDETDYENYLQCRFHEILK